MNPDFSDVWTCVFKLWNSLRKRPCVCVPVFSTRVLCAQQDHFEEKMQLQLDQGVTKNNVQSNLEPELVSCSLQLPCTMCRAWLRVTRTIRESRCCLSPNTRFSFTPVCLHSDEARSNKTSTLTFSHSEMTGQQSIQGR